MQTAIPCMVMRGGTSKGLYFLASDLPTDPAARDQLLLAAMGSPDGRQIAFTSGRDGNEEIYVMSPDGSNQTNLTNNPADESYPDWSPGIVRELP